MKPSPALVILSCLVLLATCQLQQPIDLSPTAHIPAYTAPDCFTADGEANRCCTNQDTTAANDRTGFTDLDLGSASIGRYQDDARHTVGN